MAYFSAASKQGVDGGEHELQELDELRISTAAGGLIILGPSPKPLRGIETLLSSPEATPVEVNVSRLSTWKAAAAEVLDVTRRTSKVVRDGKTAVVYLDSHRDAAVTMQPDKSEFVCARLGQILVGLADAPAYVAIHGEAMAHSLIHESLGDTDLPLLGEIGGQLAVSQLSNRTMFDGIAIVVCPGELAVTAVVQVLDWFEARRVEPAVPEIDVTT